MSQLPWCPDCASLFAISRNSRSMAGASMPASGSRNSPNAGISPSIQAKCWSCASTSAISSASITAIDVDVAVRQITSPDAGIALAEPDVDRDFDLAALHRLGGGRFVVFRRTLASFGDDVTTERDSALVAICRFA